MRKLMARGWMKPVKPNLTAKPAESCWRPKRLRWRRADSSHGFRPSMDPAAPSSCASFLPIKQCWKEKARAGSIKFTGTMPPERGPSPRKPARPGIYNVWIARRQRNSRYNVACRLFSPPTARYGSTRPQPQTRVDQQTCEQCQATRHGLATEFCISRCHPLAQRRIGDPRSAPRAGERLSHGLSVRGVSLCLRRTVLAEMSGLVAPALHWVWPAGASPPGPGLPR